MANETVIIGCKLPSGLVLEVGYSIDPQSSLVKRSGGYKKIVLKGWHAHTEEARKAGILLPAGMNMKPFLNRNVDKAAWDQWKKEHADSWLLKNNILFEAKDEASAAVMVADSVDTPKIFAPIDPKKPVIPGVEPADFMKQAS